MRLHYFDPSALLPILMREPSAPLCDAWLSIASDRLGCPWVDFEVRSVLWRQGPGRLGEDGTTEALERWSALWSTFLVLPIEDVAGDFGFALPYRLRAGDAFHLAACLHAQRLTGASISLYTLDEELRRSAERAGLSAPAQGH